MPVAGICQPMMHGHGKMGATPTSDTMTREQHYCLRVGAALDLFIYLLLLLLLLFLTDSCRLDFDSRRFGLN